MIPFEFSCFISYRTSTNELPNTFIEKLREALNNEIEPRIERKVYRDTDNIKGGDKIGPSVAAGLGESLCMILVFTPTYFNSEKLYCTREYLAMKQMEEKRLEAIQGKCNNTSGFIIPIVFRGLSKLPSELKDVRHYDFSQYTLIDTEIIKSAKYGAVIREIAEKVEKLSDCFRGMSNKEILRCKAVELPTEAEAKRWLKSLDIPPSEFPGP